MNVLSLVGLNVAGECAFTVGVNVAGDSLNVLSLVGLNVAGECAFTCGSKCSWRMCFHLWI